ncbi:MULTISPECIES: TerD family protein [Bacillaceae]|uniref:TerD family protein n=1 Tax=Bacillaceae TaxID=186817 RepID=UPI001E35988B|nr:MULTISPECIES: TerD family protein [Bacillaceae]MCE4047308.1 TerD family protein [Bacillus sp. Au-Bac7]MCM3030586.1 TerD family protein [Niallia sp. MER 6]MDL0437107.1 TerD family protein [Niallia sp. SS-2023]UPO86332.1 TerD family protein [Niallia sp. Man26]
MAINLQKGQKVDLTKGNPGLSKIMVGLGWDPVQQKGGGGLFGSLFGGGGSGGNVDCDASVLMLDENGKVKGNSDVIYFGNLKSRDGSVQHSGDNLTGDGAGDDEQVFVELSRVPASVHRLVFVVNIYDAIKRKQHFGMIQNAFIRIVNPSSNDTMLHYNLTDNYNGMTSLIVGELYRHGQEWKFGAIGSGTSAGSLGEVVKSYS